MNAGGGRGRGRRDGAFSGCPDPPPEMGKAMGWVLGAAGAGAAAPGEPRAPPPPAHHLAAFPPAAMAGPARELRGGKEQKGTLSHGEKGDRADSEAGKKEREGGEGLAGPAEET